MNWVAVRILMGEPRRYYGLVLGVAFATLLMAHQMSVFCGVMGRTMGQIRDIHPDGIWVMDPDLQYVDEVRPMSDGALYRVRGVEGVSWAVPLFKGGARARTEEGRYRQVILVGLDDSSLVGAPRDMVLGSCADLRKPDAVILDEAGYTYLWPGEPLRLGRTMEINDRRAELVGICRVTLPFQTVPIAYTLYGACPRFALPERRKLSFVLVEPDPTASADAVCAQIRDRTGLLALTGDGFCDRTLDFYFRYTGIPLNFGVTVSIGLVVGIVIVGQTFYVFTTDNLRQFGVLKAMGVGRWTLIGMVMIQAAIVAAIGFGTGIGAAALLLDILTRNIRHLAGFFIPWQVMAGTAATIGVMMAAIGLVSVRRVLTLEAAAVFRN